MFAALGSVFRDLTQCFTMALAVAFGMWMFYASKWCDKTIGKSKPCDTTKKMLFSSGIALLALVLLKTLMGGGFGGGGYGGGYGGY